MFFSEPLDLDWSMLKSYPAAYQTLEPGMSGPSGAGDAFAAVLGAEGDAEAYPDSEDAERMSWYRYLFLGRGKPSTHLRVLADVPSNELNEAMPQELSGLIAALGEALS